MPTILITGASSGVGAATARVFAAKGDDVLLVARSAERLAALASDIGARATPLPCDAADPDAVAEMAVKVLSRHGAPDVVVHCAGAGQWKTAQDTTPAEAVTMMQAPYFAAFNVTHAFLPAMLSRDTGTIISVNSPSCLAAWPSSVAYTAARAALRGFAEALAQDLHGTGLYSCHVIFGKISSDYFTNNPGVLEKMPLLAKTLPTLTSETCAEVIIRLAKVPRHTTIRPHMLRAHLATARIAPGLVRWLLRL